MESFERRVFRTHGVEIDLDTGRITRGGEQVYLRQKAHQVLLCLVEQRDQPVSKDELIRRVWDGAVGDEVLTGCVREIRKALGDDARQPTFIRTMPKNGYWFVAVGKESIAPPVEAVPEPPPAPAGPEPANRKPARSWKPWAATGVCATVAALFVLWPRTQPVALEEGAWWRLNEGIGTAIGDSSGGRRASVPPDVRWVPGVSGSALAFDGRDTVVTGEDTGNLPRGDAPRTMSAWIKASGPRADSAVFFKYGASGPATRQDTFSLSLHEGGQAWFGHSLWGAASRTRVDDGRWRYLAGVFDGQSAKLFVDGIEETASPIPKDHLGSEGRTVWSIGRSDWGGTPFRGQVDDVRVFSRALRPAEVQALYRCTSGAVDLDVPGRGAHYLAPVFGMAVEVSPVEGEASARLRNSGKDYAGAAFVRGDPDCAWRSTLASNMGQDLEIEMEIRVGGRADGPIASAGPYFRSRRSAPGDGIVGGTSAGYWVELLSTGQVRVKRLHPGATVAFSPTAERFDPDVFHSLRVSVHGGTMEAALDGRPLTFDQEGTNRSLVDLPPAWESATPPGRNQGAAGIAFACEGYRNQVGGQEVRNVRLKAHAGSAER